MNMKKGFTLIEIMIVVAIIAILAAIAIPNFISYRRTSQENACKANLKTIENACEAYLVKNSDTKVTAITQQNLREAGLLKASADLLCPVSKEAYTISITDDGTKDAKVTVVCNHGGSTGGTSSSSSSSGGTN